MMKKLDNAITLGLDFLAARQSSNGSFISLTSPDAADFSRARPLRTVFTSALILGALNTLELAGGEQIKAKTARFLRTQKSPQGTFNYWPRRSAQSRQSPYPDDLDDTFCALSALCVYDPKSLDGRSLAAVTNVLVVAETKEGGPYQTWIVPPEAEAVWRDVDLAVNSNVAYFLSLQNVELPSLRELVEAAIRTRSYASPYYPDDLPVLYFVSRFYQGGYRDRLAADIVKHRLPDGSFGNPLRTALMISALLKLGNSPAAVRQGIEYLLANQAPDGSWPAAAFCLDPYAGASPRFSGGAELTTAFALEALALYCRAAVNSRPERRPAYDPAQAVFKAVCRQVLTRFKRLDPDLRMAAEEICRTIVDTSLGRQIVLTPWLFHESLRDRYKKADQKTLVQLGAANLYGWIAYTIYDDFLDEEGDPAFLSAANLALRELTLIFNRLPGLETSFWPQAEAVLDKIDGANTWETCHARAEQAEGRLKIETLPAYGRFEILADRSFGHALGPLAILRLAGFGPKSRPMLLTTSFFRHFLIARQLNDDAHDWEGDLARGQLNAVASHLLKERRFPLSRPLETTIQELQQEFWEDGIKDIALLIKKHTRAGRRALAQLAILDNPSLLAALIDPIEAAAATSLEQHKAATQFLIHLDN